MAASELTSDEIFYYLKDNGGKVKNHDVVNHFKHYLVDPQSKDENRIKFKQYINKFAHTKLENQEKYLFLKTKYLNLREAPVLTEVVASPSAPQFDPRNSIGIPVSPAISLSDFNISRMGSSPRQPPPYRPPPPPPTVSPSHSLDNTFISSNSLQDTPQAPPRRKNSEKLKFPDEDNFETPHKSDYVEDDIIISSDDKQTISVKERTQKFNRLASVEDDLSPKPKLAEKNRINRGVDEDDGAVDKPIEPKKCVEWYVTASKGDLQELLKLANSEPRLVKKKDPFTNVLHWGAKYGNTEIIKVFAGKYKVDVNGKTNGGYTPLHISAQFGRVETFKLLIDVYKADNKIRDYSGKTPDYYLQALFDKEKIPGTTSSSKHKGRKKQTDKDLGFLRIGSLNVRVKKTTEAFSNFLGVGSSINPMDTMVEKVHKGWGSADNVNKEDNMVPPKNCAPKKKIKRTYEGNQQISTPSTPNTPTKHTNMRVSTNDSDSDTAAGFDSHWK